MDMVQKQVVLIAHAVAITLTLPFWSYSMQWLEQVNGVSKSVIHPSHQVEALISEPLRG